MMGVQEGPAEFGRIFSEEIEDSSVQNDPRYRLQSQRLISDYRQLPWELSPEEEAYFAAGEKELAGRLPFMVSSHYLSLAGSEPSDPLRAQIVPRQAELQRLPYESHDPLGEDQHSPGRRMVHQYPSRLLVLLNDNCALYCRHCFRRRFSGQAGGSLLHGQLSKICAYISEHPEIQEILLTGGDALLLASSYLREVLRALRQARPDIVFRVASRLPVVLPQRFNPELLQLLREFQPLWLITHFNHRQEINEVTEYFVKRIVDYGIPMLNQCVLLAGVNDDVSSLQNLMEQLVRMRVKPYYLFQGDLAEGTSHFRVPLERSWAIVKELRQRLSGIAMPQFAVDLPGGGGKIPLTENYLLGEEEDSWLFQSYSGKIFRYPKTQ